MQSIAALLLVSLAVSAHCQLTTFHPFVRTVHPGVAPVAPWAPLVTASQFHAQDELGQASFGYAHPGQAASNFRDAWGNQVGSWAYIDANGKEVRVSYVADANGFRVLSNDLPVAPSAPAVPASLVGPAPVADTAEVQAAKNAHFAAHAEAKARLAGIVRRRRSPYGSSYSAPVVKHVAPVVHHQVAVPAPVVAPVVHEIAVQAPVAVPAVHHLPTVHHLPAVHSTAVHHLAPAPVAVHTLSHAVHAAPIPTVHAAPFSTVHAAPLQAVHAAPLPAVHAAPLPAVHAAPLSVVHAAPAPVAVPVAAPVAAPTFSKFHSQDELGQAAFGHVTADQSTSNFRDAFGNQVGHYSYINPDGQVIVVHYTAGFDGFRVLSNALPEAPSAGPVPVAAVVVDTPEVAEARRAHFAAVEEARNRIKQE